MSTEPAETLVEAVGEVEPWARLVEDHLDAHPLPADPATVEDRARRLEARIATASQHAPSPSRWWLPLAGLALAATALLALSTALPRQEQRTRPVPSPTALQHQAPAASQAVAGPAARVLSAGPLQVSDGGRVLTGGGPDTTVLLVLEGEAMLDATPVPAGHWAVATTVDGEPRRVVFPDGTLPPAEVLDWDDAAPALRDLRFEALPDRTRSTLDRLLED